MTKALLFQGFVFLSTLVFSFAYFFLPLSGSVENSPISVKFACRNHPTKRIALTFDADMTPFMARLLEDGQVHSWYNQDLMEYLRSNGIHATLFLTGMWAEIYPYQAYKLARNPLFEIADHSYSHPSFDGPCYGLAPTTPEQKVFELGYSKKVIKQITGVDTKYFRFPGGCFAPADKELVKDSGMQVVGWDIVSGDSFGGNTSLMAENVVKRAHDGAIVVAHMHAGPNAPKTADAMKLIIPELQKMGYSFVTISDLIQPKTLIACK